MEIYMRELMRVRECKLRLQDIHGCTCLHYAARAGHLEICKLLLAQPTIDAAATDALDCNALHCASAAGA